MLKANKLSSFAIFASSFASLRETVFVSRQAAKLAKFALIVLTISTVAYSQTGVKGKVRDPKGNGIAGASIEARQEGKVVKSTKSDSKGNFSITLDAGTYNVAFDADGYSTGILYKVPVKLNKMSDLGDNLIMTRDKGSLVLVKGIVFDKNNYSVYGAVVDLCLIKADGSEKKVATAVTNEFGDFAFRGQEATGKYRVKAAYKGVKAATDIAADQPQIYRTAIHLDYERGKDN